MRDVVWCQEEPQNQGAWYQIRHRLDALSRKEVLYAGRAPASAPATGLSKIHELEQNRLIEAATARTQTERYFIETISGCHRFATSNPRKSAPLESWAIENLGWWSCWRLRCLPFAARSVLAI